MYNESGDDMKNIKLKGSYNEAIIYTNKLDDNTKEQLMDVLNNEWMANEVIRVMPDVHFGFGVPIGYTQTLSNKVVPNFVGVDIGCGMLVTKLSRDPSYPINFDRLEEVIKTEVPSGFSVFNQAQKLDLNLEEIIAPINNDRAKKSLGTLGGGNHFIEVNKGTSGLYLVIHSGSRHLGVEVCNYWTSKIDANKGYLDGDDYDGYLNDMKIAQKFASLNRKAMRDNIFKAMKFNIIEEFETIHNYIDLENMILRKGAISAKLNEIALIPLNMKDGSLIVRGKGNKDWNYSAPHGAGRVMSRNEAKSKIPLKDFHYAMRDVWTKSVSNKTLDESPFVYKDKKDIIDFISDTVDVIEYMKSVYNFKAN